MTSDLDGNNDDLAPNLIKPYIKFEKYLSFLYLRYVVFKLNLTNKHTLQTYPYPHIRKYRHSSVMAQIPFAFDNESRSASL